MRISIKTSLYACAFSCILPFLTSSYAYAYPPLQVVDTTPSWKDSAKVFFYTSRNLVVDGKEVIEPLIREDFSSGLQDGLAIHDESQEDKLSLLVKMPGVGNYASLSTKNIVTFSDHTKIGVIDFSRSAVNAININRVFRFDASWSPDGNSLVMSGTHSPTDKMKDADQDIFVSEIKIEPSAAPVKSTRSIVQLLGVDKLPFYSLKGDWIYS